MIKPGVVYEAIVVGIYTDILFRIVTCIFKKSSILTILIVGILKHFLGYYLQLQSGFCYFRGKGKAIITDNFINECILEGIVFTIIYLLLHNAFIAGFSLHVISEYIGIHKLFIKYRCQK
jgi:hypothetical protein